jgi:GR25 family glycosyltransferase involved in LPS biosynthesis
MIKAVCLCLPEYPKQIEEARAHFAEAGLENVEFFTGINAEVAGLATWHCYERDNPGTGFKIGTKCTGIWLSHWILWAAMMRENCEHIMVLETDARFLPGWKETLAESMDIVPTNFDFLYPGHCCLQGHPKTLVGGDVWETKSLQCTHAYIARRAVLPFMLQTLRRIHAPIDIQMQLECFPHLHTYAIVPRIVEQLNTIIPP